MYSVQVQVSKTEERSRKLKLRVEGLFGRVDGHECLSWAGCLEADCHILVLPNRLPTYSGRHVAVTAAS